MSQNRKKHKRRLTVAQKERMLKHRRYDERLEGEVLYYFLFHNLFSGSAFLFITTLSGIWSMRRTSILSLFTSEFFELIFWLFIIYSITGYFGRITAFFLLRWYLKTNNKFMKKWADVNKGINKMGIVWWITILVSSVIFALGIIAFLQDAIFDKNTMFTLIATYLIVRSIIWIGFKIISYFKLN